MVDAFWDEAEWDYSYWDVAALAHFTFCPECNSPHITRLGSVGKKNIEDSDLFQCLDCLSTFHKRGGETMMEAFLSKRL
jgi:hypothetical protein